MKFINEVPKKYLYTILGVIIFLIAAVIFMLYGGGSRDAVETGSKYTYSTYVESKLADDVSWYLSGVDVIDKDARDDIADYSVQNYNAVIRSGTAAVTDEHSEALTGVFKNKLEEYASGQLTEEELCALSSGISAYVWQAVLTSLNDYKATDLASDRDTEYMELAKSLQAQIDALEEKRMNIHITARIKDDGSSSSKSDESETTRYIGGAGAYESVNSDLNSDIDKKLNGMKSDLASELEKELNGNMTDDINKKMDGMKSDLNSELEKLKNSIKDGTDGKDGTVGKDGKNGEDGEDGKDGKDGKNGEDGEDGEDGKDGKDGKNGEDGKDGQDGKSTYVAYADDASGNGFSLTPTETSKYIGTCITTADNQPSNVSEYGNWQLYRNYIITSATDENNNTTLYIK